MKIIISGAYAIGCHLARLLSREHEDIVVMDTDEERFSHIGSDVDILTMEASSTSIEALKNAGAEKADLFIAVTPDESKNMNSCVLAKALGTKKTVAKIDNAEYIAPDLQEFFSQLGVSKLIYPEMLAATDINNGLKMSWVRQRWDVHGGALVMLGVKLRETCTILDRPMREICGPEDPFHIVAIKRGDDTIIPGGNDCLQMYDLAYFMTTKQYIPYVRKIVGKEHYVDVKNVMIMGGGATAVRTVKTMPSYMDVKIIETDEQRCERLNSILERLSQRRPPQGTHSPEQRHQVGTRSSAEHLRGHEHTLLRSVRRQRRCGTGAHTQPVEGHARTEASASAHREG